VADWGFLTNHARVLLCISHDPVGAENLVRVTRPGRYSPIVPSARACLRTRYCGLAVGGDLVAGFVDEQTAAAVGGWLVTTGQTVRAANRYRPAAARWQQIRACDGRPSG
jgi:hypothetical protein